MPTLPNITQGQMALDPVNQIIYYKTEADELKSVTLKWLQESGSQIDTTDNVSVDGNFSVGGNFVITGNLTVNGTTTTLNTESILVEDNFLVLNSNASGLPSTNAGLEVERGDSPNVVIRWNEGSDRWEFTDTDPSSGPWYPLVKSTDDLTEGSVNKYFTNERAQDTVNDALTAGTGVSKEYNDGLNTITISIGQPVGITDNVIFNQVTADVIGQVSDISNHGISDLSDVTIVDAANGDFLRYNGANWINDPVNLTTDTVGDYVATVVSGTGISITNTGGEGATPNVALNAVLDNLNDVVISGATPGQTLQFDGTNWVNSVNPTMEPIGHENKADSVISFNESTREFTIAPVSSSFTVWCVGKKFTKTSAQTIQIPDTPGLHYIFFDSEGRLGTRQSFFNWESEAPTAYVYWNNTDQKAYFFADERHGIVLDWATHEYLHRTRGAAIANGFGANNYTTSGLGTSNTDAQIDIANGTFFDEDLQVDITHNSSPVANTWQQRLQGGSYIPVFYRLNNHWKKDVATQFPLKQGTSRPQFNLNSGGTWTTADITNNHFGVSWIIATNNLNEPIIAVLGQQSYGDKGSAEADFYGSLDLDGFPIVEFRPLYKIVYECKDSYVNTPKAAFRTVSDLRSIIAADQGVSAVAVSDHGSLTGIQDDDHPQYLNEARHNLLDHSIALGTASVNDLADVNISSPVEGQGLIWSGDNWYNAPIPLSLDGLNDVIITSATPNQVLKWNGTNWVNDESPSDISGTTYSTLVGDGSETQFVINHDLSTRNVVVSITEENPPHGAVSVHWEATDINTITLYFASAPENDSIRVNVYAAVSGLAVNYGTTYTGIIGDGVVKDFTVIHNLGTRDVFVQFINPNSPYEQFNVAWEAYSVDSIKAYFDEAPAANSVKVLIYSSLSGNNVNLSLEEIDNVNISSATPEQFLKWDGTNWINTSSIEKLQVQEVLNLTSGGITVYSSATPNSAIYQMLGKQDGSIPFAVRTNFSAGGDFYYTTAGVQEDGSFYGSNFIAFSDSTSGTAFQTRDQSPFAPFTISNDGQLSWNNIYGSASIRLSTSASDRLIFNANVFVGSTYTITSQGTYNNSVGAVRDVFVTASGLLGVNLSSERYKEDIENITIDPQKVYQIQPVEFKYKEGFINEEAKDQKFIGLIAEQLHEIGLDKFVEYNEEGVPDSVRYSMLSLALIETVKDLNNRLLILENK